RKLELAAERKVREEKGEQIRTELKEEAEKFQHEQELARRQAAQEKENLLAAKTDMDTQKAEAERRLTEVTVEIRRLREKYEQATARLQEDDKSNPIPADEKRPLLRETRDDLAEIGRLILSETALANKLSIIRREGGLVALKIDCELPRIPDAIRANTREFEGKYDVIRAEREAGQETDDTVQEIQIDDREELAAFEADIKSGKVGLHPHRESPGNEPPKPEAPKPAKAEASKADDSLDREIDEALAEVNKEIELGGKLGAVKEGEAGKKVAGGKVAERIAEPA
ncbi:hypothetical protein HY224_02305, partial [Candidatus Uhrbacteria bacterium]|nr:hypothetical protein [Candidatus Uhrbacteria bacterium]